MHGHALSLLISELPSSAWLQLILFGLHNCGQSVFNFLLSMRPEVESEVRASPENPLFRFGFGEMSAKCWAWLVPVGRRPAAGP